MNHRTATARTDGKWQLVTSHPSTHYVSYSVVSSDKPSATEKGAVQEGVKAKAARKAVYAHIQALRSLGKTRVNTREIAEALGLSRSIVEQAVVQLRDEGVKPAK